MEPLHIRQSVCGTSSQGERPSYVGLRDPQAGSKFDTRSKPKARQHDFAPQSETQALRTLGGGNAQNWTWLGPFSRTVLLSIIRSSPWTLVGPLAVFLICTALGVFGVMAASKNAVHVERGRATELAMDAARRMELQIQQAFTPTLTLEVLIKQNPSFQAVQQYFPDVAAALLTRVLPGTIANIQLAPGLVVQAIYPLTGNEAVMGLDLLASVNSDPLRRADTLWSVESRNLTVVGPYKLLQGGYGVLVRQPVFISNVSEHETFGAKVTSADCGPCWDAATRTRFWGFAQAMARLDGLLQGSDNRMLTLQNYGPWHLTRVLTDGSQLTIATGTSGSCDQSDCVSRDVRLPNAVWRLYLGKDGGWAPDWGGLLALVVIGSFIVAVLLFCLLVAGHRHHALLRAMFPAKVLRTLQQGNNFSEEFNSVTILFSDIVSYTTISSSLRPIEVAEMLNELYCEFDELVDKNRCYKVETIGDAFMAVGGCPHAEAPEVAAERAAMMALDMVQTAARFRSSKGHCLRIRVGLASGPVAAAVIGRKMPRYCLFGDTVNLASRMESTSQPMRIQLAASTAELLRACTSASSLCLQPRGQVHVKGKGDMECFWLEAADPNQPVLSTVSDSNMDLWRSLHKAADCPSRPTPAVDGGNRTPTRPVFTSGSGAPTIAPAAVDVRLASSHSGSCSQLEAAVPAELRWTASHLFYRDGGSSNNSCTSSHAAGVNPPPASQPPGGGGGGRRVAALAMCVSMPGTVVVPPAASAVWNSREAPRVPVAAPAAAVSPRATAVSSVGRFSRLSNSSGGGGVLNGGRSHLLRGLLRAGALAASGASAASAPDTTSLAIVDTTTAAAGGRPLRPPQPPLHGGQPTQKQQQPQLGQQQLQQPEQVVVLGLARELSCGQIMVREASILERESEGEPADAACLDSSSAGIAQLPCLNTAVDAAALS